MKIVPVILAGGAGTRFWPLSRESKPKQFLQFKDSGESLLQVTAKRTETLNKDKKCLVVTTKEHSKLVKDHLPNAEIVTEPARRNTAAAIGLAAVHVEDPESVMLVLPSDHYILETSDLINLWYEAAKFADSNDYLVTIGIEPSNPNTGYGYIKQGLKFKSNKNGNIFTVDSFVEKPGIDRAREYVDSKQYLWNSGMFVWKVSSLLSTMEKHMPDLYSRLMRIKETIGTKDYETTLINEYSKLEDKSIDFGILEKTDKCAVVYRKLTWSDLGALDTWAQFQERDESNNTVDAVGKSLILNSLNSYIKSSEKKFIGVVGMENLVVINTKDALLILNKRYAQDVKKVVEYLKANKLEELM